MKNKIAAHLSTLTPFLRGVNFQQLEKIGPKNVRAIINYLSELSKNAEEEVEELEVELLSTKDDVMQMTEIASRIAYKRIKTRNRKLVLSNMKTVLGSMKKDDSTIDFPLLPTLRVYSPFEPGDDVMVYIGETGLESEKHPYDRSMYIPEDTNWVCAKVLLFGNHPGEYPTYVFFNNPIFRKGAGSLDGHYMQVLTTSPPYFQEERILQNERGYEQRLLRFRVSEIVF